jgi:hypothetical protein
LCEPLGISKNVRSYNRICCHKAPLSAEPAILQLCFYLLTAGSESDLAHAVVKFLF